MLQDILFPGPSNTLPFIEIKIVINTDINKNFMYFYTMNLL